ncbi:flagellar biosynthesis anti-sigma factor FlgM [Burkholderia ubonensis]|uniref:Negative regulator of flagellin synthesis n=2 Tax=Burkholderia ubonensis TaxID=101571 RepID=A0A103CV86_9BURK|nr:flagellar biosynthesis anti-sigma factor FlgM [Burkholderia ubonensis]AYZ66575.1 flagellar biosynthesis anti-sigma factor FlgM [Burkholderia multivorans]AOI71749.1 flagellar biosynthesis anti-sigma factor FlgM [Burkholderia ubonensis]AOJ64054.1 flagellar biosynthesis anti-sigma factor FlgM [Burkholderia ubonensis]KUZ19946.1 flagellar biosynthesis anti-sigma factor FlgM [Burkholderia ubonensis]KUZ36459.1 flagellar biosynthesis anti-sigma factor FlgM [Burkholderia ubonensis]
MKIDSTPTPNTRAPAASGNGAARTQDDAPAAAGPQAGAAGTAGGDATVNLSGLSGQLRTLSASGNADIDTGLVQSIKDALSNGTLTIDASKIADGVLNTARELLKQQRPQGA